MNNNTTLFNGAPEFAVVRSGRHFLVVENNDRPTNWEVVEEFFDLEEANNARDQMELSLLREGHEEAQREAFVSRFRNF